MDLGEVCRKLEEAFPDINRELLPIVRGREDKKSGAAQGMTQLKMRNIELKSLLGAGVATVGLAITGLHGLHAVVCGVFALPGAQHVWQRRKRL